MNSEKTQIVRKRVSAPTRWIVGHVDLNNKRVLHHGEGQAVQDTELLSVSAAEVTAYDPHTYANDGRVFDYEWDVSISNYVFNTLEFWERTKAWERLLACSTRVLVTVRTDVSSSLGKGWKAWDDGFITKRGTFQCLKSADLWVSWFKLSSPERTSVSLLHDGGHFAIIDVWR